MIHSPSQDELVQRAEDARRRIRGRLRETPLEPSPWLSEATGAEVRLKCENLQVTGSFKLRGALNKVLSSPSDTRFVTASTGNHAAAMAHAVGRNTEQLTIFVPKTADPAKVERLVRLGLDVRLEGVDGIEAEAAARAHASANGQSYVSPYNDLDIVAGQATLGLELLEQWPKVEQIYLALGGGGLASGCALAVAPQTRVVACSPAASDVMRASVAAGEILDLPSDPTLSDGTAGGVEAESVTFDLCKALIDDYPVVSEQQIGQALYRTIEEHRSLIEGAAAVPIATLLERGRRLEGQRIAVVLCGANISPSTLRDVLVEHVSP
ncbi:MAG: pyridoxal-phosphate dependent enzyme [Acidobacteriota bacterium]